MPESYGPTINDGPQAEKLLTMRGQQEEISRMRNSWLEATASDGQRFRYNTLNAQAA